MKEYRKSAEKGASKLVKTLIFTAALVPSLFLPEFKATAISEYLNLRARAHQEHSLPLAPERNLFEIATQEQNNAPTNESETGIPNRLVEAKIIPPPRSIEKHMLNMSKPEIMEYFGLNGNASVNKEILSGMSPEEFHFIYEKFGRETITQMIGVPCHRYAAGYSRVENLRRLETRINSEVENRSLLGGYVSAKDVLTIIGIESGGENSINCYGDGGVPHLRIKFHRDVNPLNEEQSIRKQVKDLDRLQNNFGIYGYNVVIAAYNAGEGRIKDIISSLERNGKAVDYDGIREFLPSTTRDYVDRFAEFGDKLDKEKLFEYNEKANSVKYVGPSEGVKIQPPKTPSRIKLFT